MPVERQTESVPVAAFALKEKKFVNGETKNIINVKINDNILFLLKKAIRIILSLKAEDT